MADATACFVQFPHPGEEHKPPAGDMPWNVAGHRRKYLLAPGRCLDAEDRLGDADLVFWGEWEPPSRVERRWARCGRLPRALHRPYWVRPAAGGSRQNTDPWVWGERMLYSNCKQISGPERRPTSMQLLAPGSVVCFGSTLDGEFCLDSVIVIAGGEPWVPADVAGLGVDEAFVVCTVGAITASRTDAQTRLTLYRGATLDDPVEGMYSFVPAMRADARDPRFARPAVRVPGMVNPASRQSAWGSRRPLPVAVVRDGWEAVRHQVLAAGLVLAVWLETPPEGAAEALPAASRARC
jgi:hypothetical protein